MILLFWGALCVVLFVTLSSAVQRGDPLTRASFWGLVVCLFFEIIFRAKMMVSRETLFLGCPLNVQCVTSWDRVVRRGGGDSLKGGVVYLSSNYWRDGPLRDPRTRPSDSKEKRATSSLAFRFSFFPEPEVFYPNFFTTFYSNFYQFFFLTYSGKIKK